MDTLTAHIEMTDTFSGEANYSWVKRLTLQVPSDITVSTLIRRAKKALGIQGRHSTFATGECIEVKMRGVCVVMFITF